MTQTIEQTAAELREANRALRSEGMAVALDLRGHWTVVSRVEESIGEPGRSFPTSLQKELGSALGVKVAKPERRKKHPSGQSSTFRDYVDVPRQRPAYRCDYCEDVRFVRDPMFNPREQELIPVHGVSKAARAPGIMPCPSCNAGDSADFLRERSGVPVPFYGLTFDSYTPLPGKAEARKRVEQWVEDIVAGARPSLILLGGPGVGKTHLAVAAVNALVERHHAAFYQSVNGWFAEMQAAFNDQAEGSAQQIARRLARVEVLVLDDLGAEYSPRGSEWKTSETEMLINERWEWRRPTLITTNLDAAELEQHVKRRTASRLLDYEQVQVGGADMRGGWKA